MKVIALLLAVAVSYAAAEEGCPAFQDWLPWTEKCLWMPIDEMRDDWIEACDVKIEKSKLPAIPNFPGMPDKCGHCSFKARCRKREKTDDCIPFDGEIQHCHEHADVCDMPKLPIHDLGCRYEFVPMYFQQCANRADFSPNKEEGVRKMMSNFPKFHCAEHEGDCKCCCHPYEPSGDGGECKEIPQPECPAYTEWTDYTEKCLWFPPNELRKDLVEHCDFDIPEDKANAMMGKLKLPEGINFPDRCGFCSFKAKCRKRDILSEAGKKECFPVELKKKACGNEEGCDGCGDVCVLDKMMGSCNYTENLRKMIGPGVKSRMKKLPHGMRDGVMQMLSHLPHGKCVEIDGKCNCCCHPYVPSADGTTCEINNICKQPEDIGLEFDMNLPESSSFLWF